MQAWLAKFAHVRKAAEQNPAILQRSIPGFEPAPPSQFIMGAASSREVAGGEKPVDARNCEAGPDLILETWVPGWLSSLSFGEPSISLTCDEQRNVQTMAEEMQAFREKAWPGLGHSILGLGAPKKTCRIVRRLQVDAYFGWDGKVLTAQQKEYRAAAQACLMSPCQTADLAFMWFHAS